MGDMEDESKEERLSLEGLDPKEALKALLAVKPDAEPSKDEDDSADEPDASTPKP
jgi:hypothetical protein